jgi:hypothetical protein
VYMLVCVCVCGCVWVCKSCKAGLYIPFVGGTVLVHAMRLWQWAIHLIQVLTLTSYSCCALTRGGAGRLTVFQSWAPAWMAPNRPPG